MPSIPEEQFGPCGERAFHHIVGDELMDVAVTCKFFGGTRPINAATLYRGIQDGRYPRPVKIGANSNRWLRSECAAALAAIISAPRHSRPIRHRPRRPNKAADNG